MQSKQRPHIEKRLISDILEKGENDLLQRIMRDGPQFKLSDSETIDIRTLYKLGLVVYDEECGWKPDWNKIEDGI